MKKSFIVLLLIGCVVVCNATAPNDYYNEAIGKSGSELQAALAAIIAHSDPGYDKLWSIYETTDRKEDGAVQNVRPIGTLYSCRWGRSISNQLCRWRSDRVGCT